MKLTDIVKYYSNKNIREAIVSLCKNREVASRTMDGSFGKRPDVILFEREIYDLARKGYSSFHASMERWSNPLSLKQNSSLKELDELRIGFDLILDIDCKLLEYSTICAKLLIEALKFHGIKNFSIKFSGNTGWHIGVPFESFPSKINKKEIKYMFPNVPQTIASYLKEFIFENLAEDILEYENQNIKNIIKKTKKTSKEMILNKKFNPYSFMEIDTIALNVRHLFRLPYTLNEKSWLASIPINEKEIDEFTVEWAKPGKAEVRYEFLNKKNGVDARQLVIQAYDWISRPVEKKERGRYVERSKIQVKNIKYFPPCINKILLGLKDGRKRSLFILISFLKNMGWNWNEIGKQAMDWNKKNPEPLKEGYVVSQLNWSKKLKMAFYTTPNCNNNVYYKDIGICNPDNICKRIKNPLSYPRRRK